MALAKTFTAFTATGATVYLIVNRLSDGYLLDDSDGSFGSSPADPYVAMTEATVEKGLYAKSESREAWTDGDYRVTVYAQSGGSPAPTSDAPPLAVIEVSLFGDAIVTTGLVHDKMAYVYGATSNSRRVIKEIGEQVASIEKSMKTVETQVLDIKKAGR